MKPVVETSLPWGLSAFRRMEFPHKLGISERIFGGQLSQRGVCWVRCANGVLWQLDMRNASHRWCVYGDYEGPLQMAWLRRHLHDGGDVLDSGANIGQMTLYFAPLPGVTVHAFEPTSAAGDWLTECVGANDFRNVRVLRCGLSSATCRLPIQLDEARSTLRMDWYQSAHLKQEIIDLIRLDDYLAQQQIGRVRLWKLDVEGHELLALQGSLAALTDGVIDAILIEVSESTFDVVKTFLGSVGYGLYAISGETELTPFEGRPTHNMNLIATRQLACG